MSKYSISNFFNYRSSGMSVSQLYPTKTVLDIEKFRQIKQNRKHKATDTYKIILNRCIYQIREINSMKHEEFIFEIPLVYFDCSEYNYKDCAKYIRKKLTSKYKFKIDIIDDVYLHISWH